MIKNQKQYSITKEKLEELKRAKEEFKAGEVNSDAEYELGIISFDELIKDLSLEVSKYENYLKGNFHCIHLKSFEDLPEALIASRLCRKMSQKDLAEKLGVQEQQIQRYEATNYESASFTRLVEVTIALGVQFNFEKIVVRNEVQDFLYPDNISEDRVEEVALKVREAHNLIMG